MPNHSVRNNSVMLRMAGTAISPLFPFSLSSLYFILLHLSPPPLSLTLSPLSLCLLSTSSYFISLSLSLPFLSVFSLLHLTSSLPLLTLSLSLWTHVQTHLLTPLPLTQQQSTLTAPTLQNNGKQCIFTAAPAIISVSLNSYTCMNVHKTALLHVKYALPDVGHTHISRPQYLLQ